MVSLHPLVWAGRQVLVFGGGSSQRSGKTYRFDPATSTWLPTPSSAPPQGPGLSAIWTGSLLIGWGGTWYSGLLNTGGRYDPALDSWTPTSTAGAPAARISHLALWPGREMIVWGGSGSSAPLVSGGRYDPVADTWTLTSDVNAPSPRNFASAVWTGSEMIVWGGQYLTA